MASMNCYFNNYQEARRLAKRQFTCLVSGRTSSINSKTFDSYNDYFMLHTSILPQERGSTNVGNVITLGILNPTEEFFATGRKKVRR